MLLETFRKRKAFAWFPVDTLDNEHIWLQYYLVEEKYYPDAFPYYFGFWMSTNKCWSNQSKEWEEFLSEL